MLNLARLRPALRRVVAIDAGHRRIKLLLAKAEFGRLRVVQEELIDLQAEGLVAGDEIKAHLQELLNSWGRPPVALVLPQDVSTSLILDVPASPDDEVEKQIANEAVKLGGVSDSRIVYDFVRVDGGPHGRQQFWVTLCQEGEIRERILRLGLEHEDICEVTTTANSLLGAYQAAVPHVQRAILVHLGAQSTVIVAMTEGHAAFAASFPMGGDFFTRSLARITRSGEEAAEAQKRSKNLLEGPDALPEFASVVDGWVAEVRRQLEEWSDERSGSGRSLRDAPIVAGGLALEQPGLRDYIRDRAGVNLEPWPYGPADAKAQEGRATRVSRGFEVAFGTVLQAFRCGPQPVSLVPEDYRNRWKKRQTRQRIEVASLLLACVCILALALGTWKKLTLISSQQALLNQINAGQEAADANSLLTLELVSEYENLRPVFARQQNTEDVLKTLLMLQQARSNRSYWYVLMADQQSYFSHPPALLSTNRPARTNAPGPILAPPNTEPDPTAARTGSAVPRAAGASTNLAPAKPGIIAELCVPGDAEAARQTIGDLASSLKASPLFSKVDLLSEDVRRNLADPKVVVPDRYFVLAVDFAETDLNQPVHWNRRPTTRDNGTRAPRAAN